MADNYEVSFLARPGDTLMFSEGLTFALSSGGSLLYPGFRLVLPLDPSNYWGPRAGELKLFSGKVEHYANQLSNVKDLNMMMLADWCPPGISITSYSSADPQVIFWAYPPFGREDLQERRDRMILGFARAVNAAYVVTSFAGYSEIMSVLHRQEDGYRFVKPPFNLKSGQSMISIDVSSELGGIDPTSGTIAPVAGLPFGYVRYPLYRDDFEE